MKDKHEHSHCHEHEHSHSHAHKHEHCHEHEHDSGGGHRHDHASENIHEGGGAHSHEHSSGSADAPASSDENKKLKIRIERWMEHNREHQESLEEWAAKARGMGLSDAADSLAKSAEAMAASVSELKKALAAF